MANSSLSLASSSLIFVSSFILQTSSSAFGGEGSAERSEKKAERSESNSCDCCSMEDTVVLMFVNHDFRKTLARKPEEKIEKEIGSMSAVRFEAEIEEGIFKQSDFLRHFHTCRISVAKQPLKSEHR